MLDPASAATIVGLALLPVLKSDAGKKLVESVVGKLGEKLTEGMLKKMDELRQMIWKRLRGKPGAEQVLKGAEIGSEADLKVVVDLLQDEMEQHPDFAQELRQVAQQIINIDSIEARNIQNNYGESQGMQVNDSKGYVIQAHTVNFGNSPPQH